MAEELRHHGIVGISPLRCEPVLHLGETYDPKGEGDSALFGVARAIGSKNEYDVRNCDILLAYMPSESSGTDIEMGMARALNKPVLLVATNPHIYSHPVRNYVSNWILPDLEQAVDLLIGLLGDYK